MSSQNDSAVRGLLELGFSEYEARAYSQLLREGPVSAYELAKKSGIPSSKIYQALARLVERGAAVQTGDTAHVRYAPLPPKELLGNERSAMEKRLGELELSLEEAANPGALAYVWNINDYASLGIRVERIFAGTKQELLLSCYEDELRLFRDSVRALVSRGVRVAIVLFGGKRGGEFETDLKGAVIYPHPIEDTLYEERGGRGINLVSDRSRALTATVAASGAVEGAWSENRAFALIAEDYIKHDVYIMKIVERMDANLTRTFGERYRLLRDVFSDREEGL